MGRRTTNSRECQGEHVRIQKPTGKEGMENCLGLGHIWVTEVGEANRPMRKTEPC